MRSHSRLITTFAFVLASTLGSTAWGADTLCTAISSGGADTNTAIIAVASNFYGPAQALVSEFQATTAGANSLITVCQNSTAHLLAEIENGTSLPLTYFPNSADPGFPRYDYFFAANAAAPATLHTSYGITYAPYNYAKGVPVLFAYPAVISDVSGLITSPTGATLPSASNGYAITAYGTDGADLANYTVNTSTIGTMAVAGTGAPYGVKSHTILNAMNPVATTIANRPAGTAAADYSLPNLIPGWVHSPLYDNIDVTFTAVTSDGTGSIKAGFVSLAQLYSGTTLGNYTYVKFTNSSLLLTQAAVQLKSSTLATALSTYINGKISDGTWATWVANRGYVAP